MSARRVALVTDELAPWTPGGIGQLLAHLVSDALQRDPSLRLTVVASGTASLQAAQLEERWGTRVQLVSVDGASASHDQSVAVMRALAQLEPFDAVEFADFRGLAFASIEEKALGAALAHTRIGVRIHGPASLIAWAEKLPVDARSFELERLSLLNADRVVAHLASTADAVASFFGFDAGWRERVVVEFPPLGPIAAAPPRSAGVRDLVFPTKLQAIKRPDLFVAAAARVMHRRPDWKGRAVMAAARPSTEAAAAVDALIPPELAARFVRHAGSHAERLALFASSVVVVPSDFESLSLAAWEAASQGAPLVVSARCPAFAPGTPLASWSGTVHFDGTLESLASAMERALELNAPPCLPPRAEPPWWLASVPAEAPLARGPLRVSVMVVDEGDEAALETTVASLGSTPFETVIGSRVTRTVAAPSRLVMLDVPSQFPVGACWAELVRSARGELVMALRAGDVVDRGFLEAASSALSARPELEAVVPAIDRRGVLGAAPTAGLHEPVVAVPGTVWRKSAWLEVREDAPSLEALCWTLGLDRALAGCRLVAAQRLGIRAGRPLVTDVDYVQRRLPVPLPAAIHPLALTGLRVASSSPLRHRLVDAIDARLRQTLPVGPRSLLRRLTHKLIP